jgi:hypothetical protein
MTAISMPLAFAAVIPWRPIALAMILVTLAYFALADWLYTARLAGYVCIAEMPHAPLVLAQPLLQTPPPQVVPADLHAAEPHIQNSVDRDELILSDTPDSAQ